MLNIAICEDDLSCKEDALELIASYSKEKNIEFTVRHFSNGEEFMLEIEDNTFDLIIFDIYLGKMTGIDCARMMKKLNLNNEIIFTTTSKEHIFEAFQLNATQYLIKPLIRNEFFIAMNQAVNNVAEKSKKRVVLTDTEGVKVVDVSDIVYCEKRSHYINIFLNDGSVLVTRNTMIEFWGIMCKYKEMVKLGVSFVVNLEHLSEVKRACIVTTSGVEISLPRGEWKIIKEKYLNLYCKE